MVFFFKISDLGKFRKTALFADIQDKIYIILHNT